MAAAVEILVDRAPGQVRAAAIDAAGMLVDLAIERPGGPADVGDVYRGRVIARRPALAGAFVALLGEDGFLPDSAGGAGVSDGDRVAVRVSRAAQGGKGPRLEAAGLSSLGDVALLRRGPGAVARLLALHETARVAEGWHDAVHEQVEALAEPTAPLPGGGLVTISPTPALVALDVDLGAGAGARGDKVRTHAAANARFLPEIARQIRLRNLGGAIVVDLAGLSVRKRAQLGGAFAEALAGDPMAPRFLGFSALGLAEISRPRGHAPLHERLAHPHAAALAAGRAMARAAALPPHRALALRASPALIDAVRLDPALLADLRAALGAAPVLRSDQTLSARLWRLEPA